MASQIIPGRLHSTCQPWKMDAFEQPGSSSVPRSEEGQQTAILPTVEQIERMHQEAHDEGFAAGQKTGYEMGYKAGYEAGLEQAALQAARMQALLSSFAGALAEADRTIGNDLLALALELARQMVREALRVKPELVLAVVRESIRNESAFSQPPKLYLHPDDAALVREHLNQELNGCTVCVDPHLQRGDCRVMTGSGQIDAALATRWRRIGQALGRNSGWLE